MSDDEYARELAFAVEQARRAGALLMESYERVLRVDYKSKRDVVTDVDFASEKLLIEAVRDRYPADAILAEESGHHERKDPATDTASGRTWVMDPLDGTVNYANGIPFFCVSIALVDQGRPVVGVILDPARGDLLTASSQGPACLGNEPIDASSKGELSDFVVSLAIIGPGGISRERRLSKAIRIPRRMGSAALSLAYVGSGRFDAFVQNGGLSLWDVAAAGLIAERGGAVVTDLHGGPWWNESSAGARTSIVAAPRPHHGKLLEMLAESGTRVRTRR
jgi:myo-inositol-1(or 4)-monophosphatase